VKPVKKILQNQILWYAVFALVIIGVGYFGYQKWDTDRHVPPVVSHVTSLDMKNFQTVVAAGKPIYLEICTPDVCDMEKDALEAVASKLGDKITFGVIDAKANPQLVMGVLKVMAQANGGKQLPIAFPLHIMLGPDSSPIAARVGIIGPDDIAQFALGSLMAAAQAAAAPAAPDTSTGAGPAITNPNAAPNNGATVAPAPAAKQ
jgi:hypothetical protein